MNVESGSPKQNTFTKKASVKGQMCSEIEESVES